MKQQTLLKRRNAPRKTHSRVATLVRAVLLRGLLAISIAVTAIHAQSPGDVLRSLPNLFPVPNPSGFVETYNINDAAIDLTGPFFQSLGTNARSRSSCHRFAEAWSVSAGEVQFRLLVTQGLDPISRTNVGSNCGLNINTSTVVGRRAAYSLLLNRGLIRIALGVPANPEFTVVSVQNPYRCNDTATLSMYRRPLPATNLRFLSTVMFDGRESSSQTGTPKIAYATNPAEKTFTWREGICRRDRKPMRFPDTCLDCI